MIRYLVPPIALLLFGGLASYSLGKYVSREWHPFPATQGEFVQKKLAEYDAGVAFRGRERTVMVWKNQKAALLAEALSLTPEGLDATVDVRREP